jgi:hypothetical protein
VTAPTLGMLVPALAPATWAVVALVLVVLVAVTVVCVVRARRLDRLHRRTDAARAGLADALERRGTVALRVADVLAPADGGALRTIADTALTTVDAGLRTPDASEACEASENALTRRLAGIDRDRLPPALATELVDAEQLVVLARRVHNDAVRDTLDLRSRRLVRWLRLAGTAPVPGYFEIADPQPWRRSRSNPASDRPASTGPVLPR